MGMMDSPTPKGEKIDVAERIANICILAFPKKPDLAAIAAEIKAAEDAARADGYEACQKDLVAIQSAKWSKEAYAKGFADAELNPYRDRNNEANAAYAEAISDCAGILQRMIDSYSGRKHFTRYTTRNFKVAIEAIRALRPSGSGEESK